MNSKYLSSATALLAAVFAAASFVTPAGAASPPGDIEQAVQTTTTLTGALVAAVASVSDTVPPEASLDAIAAGSEAVSMLVPDCQSAVRLVDASGNPLDLDNVPGDVFELRGLEQLLSGAPTVQEVVAGELRTLVPLTSGMHPNCVTCHANYEGFEPSAVVGAASFRVGF